MEGHYNRNTIIGNNGNFEVTCVFDLDIVPLLGYTELYFLQKNQVDALISQIYFWNETL